jgi:uncharacterized protein (DUF2126 family)
MVDSSLERVEVRVRNSSGSRYQVTCNGYALPLAATETSGEAVAGVRFRAWRTSEGFHPQIAPHVPLVFDILDTWNGRSVGGCRYHVAHPGGVNFQAPPINALEAQARRRTLFETTGHSPGDMTAKHAGVHPDFPCTLDLRRAGLGR